MKPQSSIFTDVQALRSSGEFSVDITLFFTTERYLYYQIINELGRVETLSTRCKREQREKWTVSAGPL
jgi:hypothetical protein